MPQVKAHDLLNTMLLIPILKETGVLSIFGLTNVFQRKMLHSDGVILMFIFVHFDIVCWICFQSRFWDTAYFQNLDELSFGKLQRDIDLWEEDRTDFSIVLEQLW